MTDSGTATARQPEAPAQRSVKLQVLMVEDNPADAELVRHELRAGGFDFAGETVSSAEQFRERLQQVRPDVILADYNLGQWRGMEVLDILRHEGLDIPLILVTGALGDSTAVECIKQGATDYVLKDSLAKLPLAVRRALHEQQLRKQRREAEEELAKSVKDLARSNQELEQFAYVASHDLQEPLRMVATYTQLLAEKYQGKLDAQADKYIHYAVDGALRMQTLIQDLLAFSRAGKEDIELSETDCNTVVQQALLNLAAIIHDSGAQLKCAPLPTLHANSSQLRQVFQNLVGNALKFRGPDPPMVQILAEKQGPDWLFSVADNGIGIAPGRMEDIFVVFHRLHTREQYPGNGIGLAICKRIIERHGGKIWAESEEGSGTTFRFTVPSELQSHSRN
jgi:signal transduction histidine kinase